MGSDYPKAVDLQKHKFVFAFYQDEAKQWRKQAWDTQAIARANPALPIRFGSSIALDAVLISANRVARGESLVLVLYWRGLQKMNVDYTVFVQIVDRSGNIVAGTMRHRAKALTRLSAWRIDQRIADAIVVPIDPTITPGDYTIHVGLYDLSTMQRLSVVDSQGAPIADHIVIQPLTIQ